jgi:hypothetical protein
MNLSMDQKIKVLELAIYSMKDTNLIMGYENMQIRFNSLIEILEEGEK